MSTTDLLPAGAVNELYQVVSKLVHGVTSAQVTTNVVDLHDSLKQALNSAFVRAMEDHTSLSSRLPDEFWTSVWQELSFSDRIAVSHVCRAWRTLALSTPAVWSEVSFFSALHYASCGCTVCRHTNPRAKAFLSWRRSNIVALSTVLERSQNAPLFVIFEILSGKSVFKSCSDQDVQQQFVDLLKPHASRVASFRIVTDDPREVPNLLSGLGLESFTTLKALMHEYVGDNGPDESPNERRLFPLLEGTDVLTAPALESLIIGYSTVGWWEARNAAHHLPNLTRLVTGVRDRDTIRNIFSTCPALVEVEFGMNFYVAGKDLKSRPKRRGERSVATSKPQPTLDQLKPAGLDYVTLNGVHARMDTADFFGEWPHLALHVREYHIDYYIDLESENWVVPKYGVRLFESMPKPTSMLITLNQGEARAKIMAFDDNDNVRGFSFREDLWPAVFDCTPFDDKEIPGVLWKYLSVTNIASLSMKLDTHQGFWIGPPSRELPALTNFELVASASVLSHFAHTGALNDWSARMPAVGKVYIQQNDASKDAPRSAVAFEGWDDAATGMRRIWAKDVFQDPQIDATERVLDAGADEGQTELDSA